MINILLSTYKEIIRNKILYLIVFFAVLMIIFSMLMWNLTIWQNDKIIVDFGLSMIEIFWLISVLFIWSEIITKEISWKTIFLILSKPISRASFILWKFFWLSLVLFTIFFIKTLLFFFILFANWIEIDSLIFFSPLFSYFKIISVLSIVFLLSTFMSNIMSIVSTFFVYIVWHSFDAFSWVSSGLFSYLIWFLQVLFPPMSYLNIRDFIWFSNIVDIKYLTVYFVYFLIYNAIILFLTIYIFSKKEFDN